MYIIIFKNMKLRFRGYVMKNQIVKILAAAVISAVLFPSHSAAQILSMGIVDLRTKIAGHKWQFKPGDSPIADKRYYPAAYRQTRTVIIDNEDNEDIEDIEDEQTLPDVSPVIPAWAQPVLTGSDKEGWADDIEIQRAWTRYRDKNKDRPWRDFEAYKKDFGGYGWYRTSFTISERDLKKRFRSNDLILRLGRVGQADAVYLNGVFIGSTGLKADTQPGAQLADRDLYYDKIRVYRLPDELVKVGEQNIISVRVYAKYNIAPGLSHDKFYISSARKMERSLFWDDFKKIFVIVLMLILGAFYLYWQFLFRADDNATKYFALSSIAAAVNTFMLSQIVYSIMPNALWIKKFEYATFIIFVHLVMEFLVHFTKVKSKAITVINRVWDIAGLAAVAAVLLIPELQAVRRFMFAWGVLPALLIIYLVYIFIKGRAIPALSYVLIGFSGMILLLVNEVLVGFQYRWVVWEFSTRDYAFAFFGIMTAVSIVSNMKKSKEIIQRQKTEKDRLSRYFSPDVVKTIIGGNINLGGEEKPIVTLFADVVGFTSYSESHTPAEVVSRLNEMFSRISDVVFQSKATLDKYIGDCIMAFWGAPTPGEDDAYNAVLCAMNMQSACAQLNENLPAGEKPFQLRIGINYGPSIVGNIGSQQRMDYTVIGDAVNTASRIESNGIPGKVAVSESVFVKAGGEQYLKYSEIREITVKGKSEPLKIYIIEEVLDK
jgi:class 3 adenylate cyclase